MLKRIARFLRPALVLLAVFLVVGVGGVAFQAIRTLQRLNAVEAGRDSWQKPGQIIEALNLKDGNSVVDFGSGAGYFALKLSDVVGSRGGVIAVDLRNLSLLFLRLRAFLQGKHNIRIIVGDPDDPHLPEASADSVLVLNTYHELRDPESILRHLSRALRPGGRLVIVDRTPPAGADSVENVAHHHAAPDAVEADLRKESFNIISREDTFIHPPGDEVWWLITASKP